VTKTEPSRLEGILKTDFKAVKLKRKYENKYADDDLYIK